MPLYLYIKNNEHNNHDPDEQTRPDNSAVKPVRFIIEIELSQMGYMQFDGLHQVTINNQDGISNNFDLIIRTRQPLANEI